MIIDEISIFFYLTKLNYQPKTDIIKYKEKKSIVYYDLFYFK